MRRTDTKTNTDLNGIQKNDKAFGLYANGAGFEQAVAYRAFEKPLQIGDSFSFMMENGQFEKKFDKDDPTPGSIGIVLRTSNANSSVADYNKDATFEFGFYQGKSNYQIYDGSENADSLGHWVAEPPMIPVAPCQRPIVEGSMTE